MESEKGPEVSSAELRRAAEDRLKETRSGNTSAAAVDPQRLLHELQVHQIELEMQNAELRRAADEWSYTFAKTSDLIAIIDNDYRFIRVNPAMAAVIGRAPEDCIGLHCYTAFAGRDTPYPNCPHQRSLRTMETEKAGFYEPHLGRHLQVINTPYSVADGTLAGTILVAHDVTSFVQQEQIIKEKQQQLEVLNQSLETRIAAATEELTKANRKLRRLSLQRVKDREEEHRQLAREVHDEIGQMLVAIKFDLARIKKDTCMGEESRQAIATADEEIALIMDQVQTIIAELRPAVLDDLGLCAAIHWQADSFTKRTRISCRVDLCSSPPPLSKDQETALFYIAKQALNNVSRHAGATEVTIGSCREQRRYTYHVADNGRGITDRQVTAHDSFGIMGMLERAELIGAVAEVEALPERGTIVRVHIPL